MKVKVGMYFPNKALLVLYQARGKAQLPLRAAVRDHLFAWGRYARHPVIYHNYAYGFNFDDYKDIPLKAIVLDTLALSARWDPSYFLELTSPLLDLARFKGVKIAMPQDEFIHTDILCDFLNAIGVTHVLTAAEPREARKIYVSLGEHVVLRSVLTGYLDPRTLWRIRWLRLWTCRRDIDIGYRAWNAEAWLGEHGLLKVGVAKAVLEAAPRHPDVRFDVSVDDAKTFYGDDWYRFLLRCRATLGAEGGASILDRDGSIRERTRAYAAAHPGASFEDIRAACFARDEGSLKLFAIGPRHLEACATRTCQILAEGSYQGIFRPWVHYIPLKRDFSNMDEVLQVLRDDGRVRQMVERSWRDIVLSGRYSYSRLIRHTERLFIDPHPEFPKARKRDIVRDILRIRAAMTRHWISWIFARVEARYLQNYPTYYSPLIEHRDVRKRWQIIRKIVRKVCTFSHLHVELPHEHLDDCA